TKSCGMGFPAMPDLTHGVDHAAEGGRRCERLDTAAVRVRGLATLCVRTSSSLMDWVFREAPPIETPLRSAIRDWHHLDETEADARIVAAAELTADAHDQIGITARQL